MGVVRLIGDDNSTQSKTEFHCIRDEVIEYDHIQISVGIDLGRHRYIVGEQQLLDLGQVGKIFKHLLHHFVQVEKAGFRFDLACFKPVHIQQIIDHLHRPLAIVDNIFKELPMNLVLEGLLAQNTLQHAQNRDKWRFQIVCHQRHESVFRIHGNFRLLPGLVQQTLQPLILGDILPDLKAHIPPPAPLQRLSPGGIPSFIKPVEILATENATRLAITTHNSCIIAEITTFPLTLVDQLATVPPDGVKPADPLHGTVSK